MGQPCEFQVDEAAAGTPIAAVEMLGLWQRARVLCEALWCCVRTHPPRRWGRGDHRVPTAAVGVSSHSTS